MANKQISELTAVTTLVADDLLVVSITVGTLTRKITAANLATVLGTLMATADNTAFVEGTTPVSPTGLLYKSTAPTAPTSGRTGASRMTVLRAQVAAIESGTVYGQFAEVNSRGELSSLTAYAKRAASAQFTRPADTTAYAAGDQVTNSTTAGSFVALSFDVGRYSGAYVVIRGAKLRKSTATTTNASFRLHLFTVAPTVATAGDNATFANVANTSDSYIGAIDITVGRAFSTGSAGVGMVSGRNEIIAAPVATTLYGILEALAAYAPGNAETFDVTLDCFQL